MPTQNSSRLDSIKKLKSLYVQNKIVSDIPIVGHIGDVSVDTLQDNQVLTYSNGLWINKDATGSVINSIGDIAGVNISPSRPVGSILSFDGTNWVNDTKITLPYGKIKTKLNINK